MPNQTPNLPPPDDSADWEAIARYFAGESTPDEAEVVRRWLEAHPVEASALASLSDATTRCATATPPGLDVEAALKRVNERRDAADVIPDRQPPASRAPHLSERGAPARRWQPFALPAAAAAVLLIGGVAVVALDAERRVYATASARTDVRDDRRPA